MVFSGVFVQSKSSTLGLRVQSVVASRTFSYHFTSPAPGRGPRGRHEIEGTGAKLYKRVVNARLAKLILDNRDLPVQWVQWGGSPVVWCGVAASLPGQWPRDRRALSVVGREDSVQQRRFARSQESGQHRHRHASVGRGRGHVASVVFFLPREGVAEGGNRVTPTPKSDGVLFRDPPSISVGKRAAEPLAR